jgi:hypothetical protein
MDSRDKTVLKVFVGLYVTVTIAAAALGSPLPAWELGLYVALLGSVVVIAGLVGRDWLTGRSA